jgi:hypothetical protein
MALDLRNVEMNRDRWFRLHDAAASGDKQARSDLEAIAATHVNPEERARGKRALADIDSVVPKNVTIKTNYTITHRPEPPPPEKKMVFGTGMGDVEPIYEEDPATAWQTVTLPEGRRVKADITGGPETPEAKAARNRQLAAAAATGPTFGYNVLPALVGYTNERMAEDIRKYPLSAGEELGATGLNFATGMAAGGAAGKIAQAAGKAVPAIGKLGQGLRTGTPIARGAKGAVTGAAAANVGNLASGTAEGVVNPGEDWVGGMSRAAENAPLVTALGGLGGLASGAGRGLSSGDPYKNYLESKGVKVGPMSIEPPENVGATVRTALSPGKVTKESLAAARSQQAIDADFAVRAAQDEFRRIYREGKKNAPRETVDVTDAVATLEEKLVEAGVSDEARSLGRKAFREFLSDPEEAGMKERWMVVGTTGEKMPFSEWLKQSKKRAPATPPTPPATPKPSVLGKTMGKSRVSWTGVAPEEAPKTQVGGGFTPDEMARESRPAARDVLNETIVKPPVMTPVEVDPLANVTVAIPREAMIDLVSGKTPGGAKTQIGGGFTPEEMGKTQVGGGFTPEEMGAPDLGKTRVGGGFTPEEMARESQPPVSLDDLIVPDERIISDSDAVNRIRRLLSGKSHPQGTSTVVSRESGDMEAPFRLALENTKIGKINEAYKAGLDKIRGARQALGEPKAADTTHVPQGPLERTSIENIIARSAEDYPIMGEAALSPEMRLALKDIPGLQQVFDEAVMSSAIKAEQYGAPRVNMYASGISGGMPRPYIGLGKVGGPYASRLIGPSLELLGSLRSGAAPALIRKDKTGKRDALVEIMERRQNLGR